MGRSVRSTRGPPCDRRDQLPNYRRNYVRGGSYFFTVVTAGREPILATERSRAMLRKAIKSVLANYPASIEAIVLLPDHLHAIWTLPDGELDYSTRWGLIKEQFTRSYLEIGGSEAGESASRRKHRERSVWQKRFWEHTIRDEDDFERCFNYVHWNPMKHGLVERIQDYRWSSFHRFVRAGYYELDWGSAEVPEVPGAEWE